MIRFFKLIILGASFFYLGCSGLMARPSLDGKDILNIAIGALDSKNSSCAASDSSTEDTEILNILRSRRFEIMSHEIISDDEGVHHDFILKEIDSGIHIGAVVFVKNEKCSGYSFAQIAQGD